MPKPSPGAGLRARRTQGPVRRTFRPGMRGRGRRAGPQDALHGDRGPPKAGYGWDAGRQCGQRYRVALRSAAWIQTQPRGLTAASDLGRKPRGWVSIWETAARAPSTENSRDGAAAGPLRVRERSRLIIIRIATYLFVVTAPRPADWRGGAGHRGGSSSAGSAQTGFGCRHGGLTCLQGGACLS